MRQSNGIFMDNLNQQASSPQNISSVKVRHILGITFLFVLLGLMLSGLLAVLLIKVGGWDETVLGGLLSSDSPASDIWKVRFISGLNQVLAFLVPGLATVWLVRGVSPDVPAGVSLQKFPPATTLLLALGMMLASFPLVFFAYSLNKMIPLPEFFNTYAKQIEGTIKALMTMPGLPEFLGNLILIAVLPALGEELLFRGILQRQLMRRMQPLVAILVTGALFSFFHFQMDGFLPRWLLGMLLGWLYWRTGNFWVPVLCHFFNNGIQVVAQFFYGQGITEADLNEDVQVPVAAVVIAAAALWYLGKNLQQATAPPAENKGG